MADVYSQEITAEVLAKCENIANGEILRDIADTQAEISALEKKVDAYLAEEEIERDSGRRRLAWFHRTAAEVGVERRKAFVAYLKKLLTARGFTDG